jgi:FAD/FMN-containing dehydrogenase
VDIARASIEKSRQPTGLNRVISVDADQLLADVEPGCVLDTMRTAAEHYHLTFGPDPATHDHNTLGGMLGNNSCGVHSVMAGRTSDNVEALDIVTYGGDLMTVGRTSDGICAGSSPLAGGAAKSIASLIIFVAAMAASFVLAIRKSHVVCPATRTSMSCCLRMTSTWPAP